MKLYSRNDNLTRLECDSCGKATYFYSTYFSEFSSEDGESFCVNKVELKCPKCNTTVAPQTKIYSKFNGSSPDSAFTIPDTSKKKGKKVWIIAIVVIIIIIIITLTYKDKSGGLNSLDYGDSHYYDSNSGQVEEYPLK